MTSDGLKKIFLNIHFYKISMILTLSIAVLIIGCDKIPKTAKETKIYIPVTVMTVKPYKFGRTTKITGSILPWKEEELKFQLTGRIARLRSKTPGELVYGEVKDESGTILYPGDIVAELDTEPYQLALEEASVNLKVAEIKLEGAKQAFAVEIETIKSAQARMDATITEIEELFPLNMQSAEEQRKAAAISSKHQRSLVHF